MKNFVSFVKPVVTMILLLLPLFVLILPVSAEVAVSNNRVIVYYFHNSFRCPSCLKIEKYTKEALDSAFKDELKDGSIEYKVINFDNKSDKHYVEEYQLYTKSVVLSKIKDSKEVKWKNLDKIWELLGNKNKFEEYIKTETTNFLKGSK